MENWKVPAGNSSKMSKRKWNEDIVKNAKIKLEPAETNSSICQRRDTILNSAHPTASEERGINNMEETILNISFSLTSVQPTRVKEEKVELAMPISLNKSSNPIPAAILEEERMDTLEERMNNLEERMKAIPVGLSSIHPVRVKEERMDVIPVTSDQVFNSFPQPVLEKERIDPRKNSASVSVSSVNLKQKENRVATFQGSSDTILVSSEKASNPDPTAVLEEERRNDFVEKLDAMLISLKSIPPPRCIKEEKMDFPQEKNDAISSNKTLNPVPAVVLEEERMSTSEESINKIPVCLSSGHPVCLKEEIIDFPQERNEANPVPFDQTLDPFPLASLKKEQIDTSHESRDQISVFFDQTTSFVPPVSLKQERMDDSSEDMSAFNPVFSSELASMEEETEMNTTCAATEPAADLNLFYYSELATYVDPKFDIEQNICSQTLNIMVQKLKDFETKKLASQDILKDIDVVIQNIALSSENSKISKTDTVEKFANSGLKKLLEYMKERPQPQLSSRNNANCETDDGPEVIQID